MHKKPTFSTIVASHVSGREVRDALYLNPIWSFELTFDGLDGTTSGQYGALSAQSLQALMGLFLQSQGQYGSFLYVDPTDNSVAGQPFGTTDGVTSAFALQRTLGGFTEPVGWATSASNVYLNGVALPAGGLAAPAAPSLSQVVSSGASGRTYYAKITYTTPNGETTPSSESSLVVGANHVLQCASPSASGPPLATGWNIYVSSSSGAETLQNASPIALGTAWIEPNSGLVAGASPPSSNSTGWAIAAPNLVSFLGGAPPSGLAISADFSYAFLCRFVSDDLDFEQFMSNLWRAESVKFRSLRAQ